MIAAGGTAGHVVPAIAVADALRVKGVEVSFLGTREKAEADLVPAAGYEIDFLDVRGLDRRNPVKAAGAVVKAAAAVRVSRRLLRERGADAVMGGGGYVAGPAGLAAVRMGLPLVLTEADSHLGLANRMLAKRARRVCLAFPLEGRDGDLYRVTGRPVPREIGRVARTDALRHFAIPENARVLLVFGGSLGALTINQTALAAFSRVRDGDGAGQRDFHVLHISGHRDHAILADRLGSAAAEGYTLVEFEPGLAMALAASDLVLARSGGSVFEIAAAGLPAILVPYPHATGDHQTSNARWMEGAGAAVVIPDAELDPERLAGVAEDLFADPEHLAAMAAASRSLAKPNAAEDIAAEILAGIAESVVDEGSRT